MKTARDRMRWFIWFAETDLHQLRHGDVINLREDIWLLLHGLQRESAGEALPLTQEEEQQLTLENFAAVQPFVREWLRGVAQRNELQKTVEKRAPADFKLLFKQPLRGSIQSVSFSASRSSAPWITVEADNLYDSFLFALGVAWCGMNEIELKACPTCTRLFLIDHGRQQFCSFKCKNKEAQRRYREAHREKETKRGRENYEKKIKKKPELKNAPVRTNRKRTMPS